MHWIFNEFYVMIYTSSFIYYSLKSCIDHMTNGQDQRNQETSPEFLVYLIVLLLRKWYYIPIMSAVSPPNIQKWFCYPSQLFKYILYTGGPLDMRIQVMRILLTMRHFK